MNISQTPLLSEIAAGHLGPPIPASKRAYFQQRLRNRVFNFLLEKFSGEKDLTKATLARRIEKTPDVVNRWLGAPSNLTLDTISDLLLGIASEELELGSTSPLDAIKHNYSHFEELSDASRDASFKRQSSKGSAESLGSEPQAPTLIGNGALEASSRDYNQNPKSGVGVE